MMNRFLGAAILVSASAAAQTMPARLDLATAERIAGGCRAHAAARAQSHGIAVTDTGGHLVLGVRMDGNTEGVMAFALEKAKAAALWGFPTSGMAEAIKATPGFANTPYVVTVAGGVPVYAADGRTLLGAVGVSGEAPEDDAACAEAGIKAAGLFAARK